MQGRLCSRPHCLHAVVVSSWWRQAQQEGCRPSQQAAGKCLKTPRYSGFLELTAPGSGLHALVVSSTLGGRQLMGVAGLHALVVSSKNVVVTTL